MSIVRRKFTDEFNAKEFINSFYPSVKGNEHFKGGYNFRWEQLYKFYKKYNSKWDNGTARLLEFGGGPVVTSLISAVLGRAVCQPDNACRLSAE